MPALPVVIATIWYLGPSSLGCSRGLHRSKSVKPNVGEQVDWTHLSLIFGLFIRATSSQSSLDAVLVYDPLSPVTVRRSEDPTYLPATILDLDLTNLDLDPDSTRLSPVNGSCPYLGTMIMRASG